jgi:hypothetical protein
LDPPRFKEHHLDLEVCIFIASLNVWLVFHFCFFIVASIMVLKDGNTRGTRQGIIKHVSRIRPIDPIRVLKLPKAENHPQTGHWESTFPKSGRGHGQAFSFYL